MHIEVTNPGDNPAFPLVIDLDGTLIHTDTLHEAAIQAFSKNPLNVFRIAAWLARGKACLKTRLAAHVDFDPAALPYNHALIAWIEEQKVLGRKIVMSTAAPAETARKIADHLGLFDEIHSTDETMNNSGALKAGQLSAIYGKGRFDYAGNARTDLHVWSEANAAITVNTGKKLQEKVTGITRVEQDFQRGKAGFSSWLRLLRVHQWLKNILLFVPLAASHDLFSAANWIVLVTAFMAFGLCASTVYIINDLFDLESDRLHPTKRSRPFASGLIPVLRGVLLVPVLFIGSLLLALTVNLAFLAILLVYFSITTLYSFALKKLALVDCLALATLYTLRIIAGAVALGHVLSFWMLGFSIFLFLSLAFVKRYAEFMVQKEAGRLELHGRGYRAEDAPLIEMFGVASGFISVLVLALYLNSETVARLYQAPYVMWAAIPVMLFWIGWIWLQAHRNDMHDDPLMFAVRDKVSLASGVVFCLVMAVAAVGLPW